MVYPLTADDHQMPMLWNRWHLQPAREARAAVRAGGKGYEGNA